MSKLMSIELERNVADKFLEDSRLASFIMFFTNFDDMFKLPTEKVELKLYNYLTSVEQTKKDLSHLFALANKKQTEIAMKALNDYANSDIVITYKQVSNEEIMVEANTTFKHILFSNSNLIKFRYTVKGCEVLDFSSISNDSTQGRVIAYKMMGLLHSVLTYMEEPTTVKEVSTGKVVKPSNNKKRSKNKKAKVRYIYKTIYKVKDINTQSKTKTKRSPSKEREYLKEEWQRKGHFRTYRNKETGEVTKRVWIESTTCRAKGKVKDEQQYKITKL